MANRWVRRPEGSNWGDFGSDDERGTLNILTPERRLGGFAEVRAGIAFNLSLPLNYPGGNVLFPSRTEPQISAVTRISGEESYNFAFSRMNAAFNDVVSDDAVLLFNQYSTQWDALGHWGQEFDADDDGVAEIVYYNGYRAGEHILSSSDPRGPVADRLSIDAVATAGVQGRAVLVDLAAIYGTDRIKIGHAELMSAIGRQHIEVRPGDFLCLHTGLGDVILDMDRKPNAEILANSCAVLDGTDQALLQWISESGIVAICADNLGVEGLSYSPEGGSSCRHSMMPLHEHCIFKIGMPLGELWYFGELARWLRETGRNAFLLTAPPLRLPGCVGSPVTPIGTV
ncbi:MAG: cyclase family protein [Sphingomonadaceae bacterium]